MGNDSRINLRIIIQGPVKSRTPTFLRKLYYYQKAARFLYQIGKEGIRHLYALLGPKMTGLEDKKLLRRLQGRRGRRPAVSPASWASAITYSLS